jgi:AraC-like DNA-binding protein
MAAKRSEFQVWRVPTPYGPLVMSHGFDAANMALHRHVRPHCVFVLRGSYAEGLQEPIRQWRAGDLTLFPGGTRHRTWFDGGEVLLAALRPTATTLGAAGLSDNGAVQCGRMSNGLCSALASALIAEHDRTVRGAMAIGAMIDSALDVLRPTNAHAPEWLAVLRGIIDADPMDPPPITALAMAAKRNPAHVSFGFRQFYGVTITQYIRRSRMRAAAHILSDPNLSITQAAHDAGFADAAHFARTFRNVSRTTASEVRDATSVGRTVLLRNTIGIPKYVQDET